MTDKMILQSAIMNFLLFLLMFYFLVESLAISGWTFFTLLMAGFATRNFVNAVQMGKIYYDIQKLKDDK